MGSAARLNQQKRLQERIEDAKVTRITDRFGRPVVEGGSYEFHSSLPVVFTVAKVELILNPNAPAGMFRVILEATLILPAQRGAPMDDLTMVDLGKDPPVDPGQEKTTQDPQEGGQADGQDAPQIDQPSATGPADAQPHDHAQEAGNATEGQSER